MIQEFKDKNLSTYYFSKGFVYNRKTKNVLNWNVTTSGSFGTARITLASKTGERVTISRNKIQNFLVEVPETKNELNLIIPTTGDYIMFSVVDQASQYFFAGTAIVDALAKFGRRGIVISPKDIRILDVTSNKVSMVKVKVVESYVLE